jgi:hypothetical protein
MRVTMEFTLPDDQGDYDAARLGREALAALWEIDQRCREILKHGDPSPELREALEDIRRSIPGECLEV